MDIKRISVIGLGYIGLPTAAMLASCGFQVIGVDINPEVVAKINSQQNLIQEPDLEQLLKKVVATGYLRATGQVEEADVFIIAVPTPLTDDFKPDLSYVYQAINAIASMLKKGNLVILESTSPVGTTEKIAQRVAARRPDLTSNDIHFAYCPERVMPGKILKELVSNDRVIGGLTPACAEKARMVYQIFNRAQCLLTDTRTAEMVKLTENAYRDVNIAFANELSMICAELKIDIWELIVFANHHPRVNILRPGPGVGGHCIAVDPWFIIDSTPKRAKLLKTARQVNLDKTSYIVSQVQEALAGQRSATLACLGLSYKANVNDLRESPAVSIVNSLAQEKNYSILVVEPHIERLPHELALHTNVQLVSYNAAIREADLIVILVDHAYFKERLATLPSATRCIDAQGILSAINMLKDKSSQSAKSYIE